MCSECSNTTQQIEFKPTKQKKNNRATFKKTTFSQQQLNNVNTNNTRTKDANTWDQRLWFENDLPCTLWRDWPCRTQIHSSEDGEKSNGNQNGCPKRKKSHQTHSKRNNQPNCPTLSDTMPRTTTKSEIPNRCDFVWTNRTIITKKLSKQNETHQNTKNTTWTHRKWPATPSLTQWYANIHHLNSQTLIDARFKTWFELTWDKCHHCNQNNSIAVQLFALNPKTGSLATEDKMSKRSKDKYKF